MRDLILGKIPIREPLINDFDKIKILFKLPTFVLKLLLKSLKYLNQERQRNVITALIMSREMT